MQLALAAAAVLLAGSGAPRFAPSEAPAELRHGLSRAEAAIRAAACVSCHAGRAEVAESTRAWLEQAYPGDQSFGYALGDLRGFWWAEAAK